ncbi:MAG: S4 domain-containing protein, partial [Chloroflexota bacterium]|nr:S4 domain-containing protein [Chloroflexota bacterium]
TLEQSFFPMLRDLAGSDPTKYVVSIPIVLNELGFVKSKSEARRLIKQGSIQIINNEDGKRRTVSEDRDFIQDGTIIKVGKRRFVKIVD